MVNTGYIQTNRGIIKILQAICGFIICSLLCGDYFGGNYCFNESRLGYVSGLNFVCLIINIVLFILNILDLVVYRLERLYSVIGMILFIVAFGLMLWYMIQEHRYNGNGVYIPATVLIGIQMVLFIWDYKILHGESSNW